MTPTEKRLAEIRERAEKATPGPWGDFGPCRDCDELHTSGCNGPITTDEDLSFLARTIDDIPFLLAEVDAQRQLTDMMFKEKMAVTAELLSLKTDAESIRAGLLVEVKRLRQRLYEEEGRANFCMREISKLMARNAELERLVGELGVYGPTGGPP